MGKTITSPVQHFPGSVTLADPILWPQYMQWVDAVEQASANREQLLISEAASNPKLSDAMLPGICACIERSDLAGFPEHVTPDTFPASPVLEASRLLLWLLREINAIVVGAETVPNG